jgi:hypothetical protein
MLISNMPRYFETAWSRAWRGSATTIRGLVTLERYGIPLESILSYLPNDDAEDSDDFSQWPDDADNLRF